MHAQVEPTISTELWPAMKSKNGNLAMPGGESSFAAYPVGCRTGQTQRREARRATQRRLWGNLSVLCASAFKPNSEIEAGSAPAPGAVFRALAENTDGGKLCATRKSAAGGKCWPRGRVQARPGRACSPNFGLRISQGAVLRRKCYESGMNLVPSGKQTKPHA